MVVCHLQNTTKHDHVAFLVVVGADPRFLRDKNTSFDNPVLTSIFRDAEDLVEERFTALQARGFKSLIYNCMRKRRQFAVFGSRLIDTFLRSENRESVTFFDKPETKSLQVI